MQSSHWNQPVVIAKFDVFSNIVAEYFDHKIYENMSLNGCHRQLLMLRHLTQNKLQAHVLLIDTQDPDLPKGINLDSSFLTLSIENISLSSGSVNGLSG